MLLLYLDVRLKKIVHWPDLMIVVADPHRAGHEVAYHPGETNLRMADVVIINKVDTAPPEKIDKVRENIRKMNPDAAIIESSSDFVSDESLIKEKRVLVIEDGPTVTHGEVGEGIGAIAARRFGASKIIDPRPYAKRSIRDVYAKYNSLGPVLPAIGYSKQQMKDLEETVNSIDAYSVILGTPVNLSRIVNINKPAVRVRYGIREVAGPTLQEIITRFLA